ncbi:flagellar assembly protein A [Anaerobacillus sp. MEB173]|uniref:flagellar assembly protein A n=1 Tax=Anaerobacillus sp. MEB173 TaxID=3383345 RepID=UPI003F92CFB0
MQSIVSKGKSINEAIMLGLELLDATKNDVDIEIIQSEVKGFFGIRSKEAIVKLTRLETNSDRSQNNKQSIDVISLAEQLISELPDENVEHKTISKTVDNIRGNEETLSETENDSEQLSGKVWVKNGVIGCKNSPHHFPMISISRGIQLFKNNELVGDKTILISENDSYEIKVDEEKVETKWSVSMDEHKLKVFLEVEPGYKIVRWIPDIEPDHHIELKVEESKEVYNSLTYNNIIQKLESLRVKHGFNQAEIIKAIEATEAGKYEIATGMPPKPGKDGWIELLVDINEQNGPKEKEDGSVDFREIRTIPTVDRGKVVAIIHPPVPGQIGYTVTNDPLPAKQTFPIILQAGKGVMVIDDKVVATEPGRPKIEKRGQLVKISIMSKLIHHGNVDISSGNINFKGDVEITGYIEDRMIVEAVGDITVHKTVNMATLTASGAIVTYGNIVGGELSAGKHNMLITELGHLLGILYQSIEKMVQVINQLTESPAFKPNDLTNGGLQPLIRILLERKFKGFPTLAKKYVDVVRRGEDYLEDDIWREVAVSLSQLFLSLTNEITSLERIKQLSEKMKELHEVSETPVEPNSYITIPSASNSSLYCSGNILILGQGCVNTKVHAGGMLKVNGIIRGGEVYGRLGAEINETGSESGTPTIVAVPNDQKIKIKTAMEGTILRFGHIKYTLEKTMYNLVAKLDENDSVVFE